MMKGKDALEWSVEVEDILYRDFQECLFPIRSKKKLMIDVDTTNTMG